LTNGQWIRSDPAIVRTSDGGKTWKRVLCADQAASMFGYFYNADRAWIAAVMDEDTNITVMQTIDGGQSWRRLEFLQPYRYVMDCGFSFVPSDYEMVNGWLMVIPEHGMNSIPGTLYRTGNGGESWTQVNSPGKSEPDWDPEGKSPGFGDLQPFIPCGGQIGFRDMKQGWLLGSLTTTTPSFLFETRDGGDHWQLNEFRPPLSSEPGRMEPAELPRFFGSDTVLAMARFAPTNVDSTNFYMAVCVSHDGGRTWQSSSPFRHRGVWDFTSVADGWIWEEERRGSNSTLPGEGRLYHTIDGGNSWTPVHPRKSLEAFLSHGETVTQIDFVDNDCGWALVLGPRDTTQLVQTTDGGVTWNRLDVQPTP